jgi:glycerophosphoryl diester phosphodiesterase
VVFADRPTYIAHRGLGAGRVDGFPENTLGSFLAAVDTGIGWVEVDARRTADGRLVVVHDPLLDGGVRVSRRDTADLMARGALLLDDLLEALPTSVAVDLDVKSDLPDALIRSGQDRSGQVDTVTLVAEVAKRESARRQLLLSSFDPAALGFLREQVPDVALGLLTWIRFPVTIAVPAAVGLGVEVLGLHVGSLARAAPEREADPIRDPATTPTDVRPAGAAVPEATADGQPTQQPEHLPTLSRRAIEVAHEAGLEVMVWCPSPAHVELFVDAGADAFVLDGLPDHRAHLGTAQPAVDGVG